jgi:hypothetical protein
MINKHITFFIRLPFHTVAHQISVDSHVHLLLPSFFKHASTSLLHIFFEGCHPLLLRLRKFFVNTMPVGINLINTAVSHLEHPVCIPGQLRVVRDHDNSKANISI